MSVRNNLHGPAYVHTHRIEKLKHGLSFEKNDQRFKTLLLRAISVMALLLILCASGFILWSKVRERTTVSPRLITLTTIIRKGRNIFFSIFNP